MLRNKEALTAVCTFACAMGIGFMMQNSDVAEQRYGTPKPATPSVTAIDSDEGIVESSVLDVKDIVLTSASFVPNRADLATAAPAVQSTSTAVGPLLANVSTSDADKNCEIKAVTRPIAAAMVDLSLVAPCHPNALITVHHNGMVFSETTSDTGHLALQIPALTQEAVFIIAFSTGEGMVASTTVDELADFDRAVLQWKGPAGFEIHAREFGADYGSDGHRWTQAPGDVAKAVAGESGVLTRHGNSTTADPLLAEIYTYPRHTNGQSGDVILTVEAAVTEANCGVEVEAQTLEIQPDGTVRSRSLILPVPSCDSVGSFLVLNNLLQNLKVAAN